MCIDVTWHTYASTGVYYLLLALYGGCSLGTQSSEDQLERADAGSWQIADSYYTASSAARGVAVFDFRVRSAVEL